MIEETLGRLSGAPQVRYYLAIVVVRKETLSQVLVLGDPWSPVTRRADEPRVLRLSDELAVDAEGQQAEAAARQFIVDPSGVAHRLARE
jgi:hypothetical protein